VAVNPVTNKIYVANSGSDNVTVITDVAVNDTKVRAALTRLPGDTTSFGRPTLAGKGVNRSSPGRTAMMGVLNRVGTTQSPWDWATVTSGGGTDSVTWAYNWGEDSLIAGENFVCCVPLEAQAATTNNLGLGTPFVGNIEVYPVYRVGFAAGIEGPASPRLRAAKLPTIVRGVLFLAESSSPKPQAASLLDISGRKVMNLMPGANDVRALAPGVYFVRQASNVMRQASSVTKVVLTN
jgi:hypothetical protein